MLYPTPIAKLIDSYSKLPGIGIKTATRLAFYTIGMSDDDVNEFAKNLLSAKRELTSQMNLQDLRQKNLIWGTISIIPLVSLTTTHRCS